MENMPIDRFIRQEAPNLPWGSTLVVISAQPADDLLGALLDLKRVGRSVALVKVGGTEPEAGGGNLPVFHVPDKVAWEVVQQIGLKEA